VDTDGNIIASNATGIFRVDKITGRLSRIAGVRARGTGPMGVPALQATFHSINNVSVDARGVIYFADQGNLRVVALTPSTLNTPVISSVISPGNFGAGTTLTPGGWLEIYGDQLSTTTRVWSGADFSGTVAPTSLAGVRVRIGGIDAFVQSISPGQVNAVVPDGIVSGNVAVEVSTLLKPGLTVTSDSITMIAAARAPYMLAPPVFSRAGKQYVVGIHSDGVLAGPPGLIPGANFRAIKSGNRIVLYGIGFAGVTPNVPAGNIATVSTSLSNTVVRIAGQDAIVEYAGLAQGYVGLYQFNIIVPSAPSGDAKLEILVDGQPLSQVLYLPLE
jgi:uncharacterized protein (TIGR03437 family)